MQEAGRTPCRGGAGTARLSAPATLAATDGKPRLPARQTPEGLPQGGGNPEKCSPERHIPSLIRTVIRIKKLIFVHHETDSNNMKEKEIISKFRIYDYNELPDSDRELVDQARKATQTSYAPYSGFCVGAAARLSDGTVVTGSNQENAAFPSGTCAERTALFYANASHPHESVVELAVAAYANGAFLKAPIPPCGACRQVILGIEERYGRPIRILLFGTEGTYVVDSVKALLPLQFTGETMNE